ncbi:GNAT family N-acetyltransferase [Patescibacteria group bacterium]|nr:GNAT family N-acetyltransferase [Patescibacteria group bacterium]
MMRRLLSQDFNSILRVVNDAAQACKGVIPDDRWKEPYMSVKELREQIDSGVEFFGLEEKGEIIGVMGIQHIKDVTLIRHAYVLTKHQKRGIGEKLLKYLMSLVKYPEILVGTWKDANWAIQFYEKHRFKLTSSKEKDSLLRKYWDIPERQIETSVVLRFSRR